MASLAISISAFSSNPGDIGGSVLGSHQSVNCMYSLVASSSGGIGVSVNQSVVQAGITGSSTYSGEVPGHADYCGGFWGWCSANGYCQPN